MAFLFIDTITAFHFSPIVLPDGSRKTIRELIPYMNEQKCQISFGGPAPASPKGQVTYPQSRTIRVYIKGIHHGLRCGDWVILKRNGAIAYEGPIGEPGIYDRLIVHTELEVDAKFEVKT